MTRYSRFLFLCGLCASVTLTNAQTVLSDDADANITQDDGTLAASVAGTSDSSSATSFTTIAHRYRADGVRLTGKQKRESLKGEAIALLYAQTLGDSSEIDRCDDLVASLRKDKSLKAQDRCFVAAFHDHVKLERSDKGVSDTTLRMADFEALERALISEFPDSPYTYEALWHVSEITPNKDAQLRIATSLVSQIRAPLWIKVRANALIERTSFVGKPLADILKPYVSDTDLASLSQNRPIVVYSWATWSPKSISLVSRYLSAAPAGALFLGINLDTDSSLAQDLASSTGLPGLQEYDDKGVDAPLAQALMLVDSPIAYITDANGIIQSVEFQRVVQNQ